MKRFLFLTAAFAVALSLSAVAFAGNGNGNNGNGAKTTPFQVTYDYAFLGRPDVTATCSGAHIVKPAPNAFVKDSETCVVSPEFFFTPGVYTIDYWTSDFNGALATTATVTVTANGDGTDTWNIVAYY